MTAVQRMKVSLEVIPSENYTGNQVLGKDVTWPSQAKIEFKDVQFRYYPEGPLILKNISFTIPPRSKVGIVGRTGAGKSTITISLFRLVELCGGKIEIDGVNIAELGLTQLRSRLAIIPQDPVLFEGSVRFNLDPFNNSTDAQIWEVLERTRLKDVVKSIDGELSGAVLPGGSNFSVGQRQLFCMARALLRRTPILIMDEATASVDPATDELIQKMIREEFKECTVITIAHRLNTISDSDLILVLSNGEVLEFDSPKVLLENPSSLYAQLIKETHKSDMNYTQNQVHETKKQFLKENDFLNPTTNLQVPEESNEESPFLNRKDSTDTTQTKQATIHYIKKDTN